MDKTRHAAMLASIKGNTPSEKSLYRHMVDNNTATENLEELLLEVNANTSGNYVNDDTKFNNVCFSCSSEQL